MGIGLRLYIQLLEAPDDNTRWRLIAEAFAELEARLEQAQQAQHPRGAEVALPPAEQAPDPGPAVTRPRPCAGDT
jgi:hypothetical protein